MKLFKKKRPKDEKEVKKIGDELTGFLAKELSNYVKKYDISEKESKMIILYSLSELLDRNFENEELSKVNLTKNDKKEGRIDYVG